MVQRLWRCTILPNVVAFTCTHISLGTQRCTSPHTNASQKRSPPPIHVHFPVGQTRSVQCTNRFSWTCKRYLNAQTHLVKCANTHSFITCIRYALHLNGTTYLANSLCRSSLCCFSPWCIMPYIFNRRYVGGCVSKNCHNNTCLEKRPQQYLLRSLCIVVSACTWWLVAYSTKKMTRERPEIRSVGTQKVPAGTVPFRYKV